MDVYDRLIVAQILFVWTVLPTHKLIILLHIKGTKNELKFSTYFTKDHYNFLSKTLEIKVNLKTMQAQNFRA